ncbi:MAG: DUF2299 family protein [Bacteroidetes bacterium]|nr:DUF2299 family protein [Bacteroidota bacterium]
MTKTPEQLKNMVEDYIKTTTLKYEDRTKKSQKLDPRIQWQFVIAKFLTITKMSHRDDRIILNYGLKFSPEHQNASKNLSNEEWTDFVHDMNQFILLQGLTYQYDSKENEIKILCWNEQHPDGLYFFPSILVVGAINWLDPVASNHIKWFVGNMKKMGLSCGILFAVGKLTEDDVERSDTRDLISLALGDEREVIILDGSDLEKLSSSERLVALIKEKLCELAVA